jgi:conjugative transfer signal peptidase TraF
MKYRIIRNLAVVAVVVLVTPRLMKLSRLHFNWTSSEPIGLYGETSAPLERGCYVLATLPKRAAELALTRHYAATPMPVLKQVATLPGDHVTVGPRGVTINGRLWPNSKPLAVDHVGRPLAHYRFGSYTVAPAQVWLLSDSPRGFDSRYLGPIGLSHINSTVEPVLTK